MKRYDWLVFPLIIIVGAVLVSLAGAYVNTLLNPYVWCK